jgi:hypothetical protein
VKPFCGNGTVRSLSRRSTLRGEHVFQGAGTMSDSVVSNRDATFRMMLQSRGAGRYGYVIGRPDLEEWGEPSLETFATVAEADEAERRAMKIAARQR